MEENIKLDLRGGRIGGRLGWGRTGGVEHLCPMASHVWLPGDRTASPCSAHLRRPRAGLKESVCCWRCPVTQLDSVQWPCQGKVLPFCWQSCHGDSEALVAEASLPILRPHLRTSRGLTATLQGSSYTPCLCTYEETN